MQMPFSSDTSVREFFKEDATWPVRDLALRYHLATKLRGIGTQKGFIAGLFKEMFESEYGMNRCVGHSK